MRRRNSTSFPTPVLAISTRRDAASISWGYFILTAICACAIAAGFFLAAKQHFNSMDLGMKNSKLRKQVEDLQTEKRRLMLAREVSLSPAEIKRAAKNLGFRDTGDVELAATKAPAAKADQPTAVKVSGPAAGVKPIKAFYPEPAEKPAAEKSVKKIVMQKPRKRTDDARLLAELR